MGARIYRLIPAARAETRHFWQIIRQEEEEETAKIRHFCQMKLRNKTRLDLSLKVIEPLNQRRKKKRKNQSVGNFS